MSEKPLQCEQMTREQFGQIVKAKRTELGLTQVTLGTMVKANKVEIGFLEHGTSGKVSLAKVRRIVRALGLRYTDGFLVRNGICALPRTVKHGLTSTYTMGCRCEKCCRANFARYSRKRAKQVAEGVPPADDPRHGTSLVPYEMGCRCEKCQVYRIARAQGPNKTRRIHYATYYNTGTQ